MNTQFSTLKNKEPSTIAKWIWVTNGDGSITTNTQTYKVLATRILLLQSIKIWMWLRENSVAIHRLDQWIHSSGPCSILSLRKVVPKYSLPIKKMEKMDLHLHQPLPILRILVIPSATTNPCASTRTRECQPVIYQIVDWKLKYLTLESVPQLQLMMIKTQLLISTAMRRLRSFLMERLQMKKKSQERASGKIFLPCYGIEIKMTEKISTKIPALLLMRKKKTMERNQRLNQLESRESSNSKNNTVQGRRNKFVKSAVGFLSLHKLSEDIAVRLTLMPMRW